MHLFIRFLFLCNLLLVPLLLGAQSDTEFWFAAPDGTSDDPVTAFVYDLPVGLRISAFGQASTVTISVPASPTFVPIVVTVPANGSSLVNLSNFNALIGTHLPGAVGNRGLRINATEPISVYYDYNGGGNPGDCQCNPEWFVLKGRNALGSNFMVPDQNAMSQGPNYLTPVPKASAVVVATEDNTTVTIVPTTMIQVNGQAHHPAGVAFTRVLNTGQTVAFVSVGDSPTGDIGGSAITADRPIAVTYADDVVRVSNLGGDMAGDQLVPTQNLGDQYALVRGDLNPNNNATHFDYVFITAVQPNTQVTINGTLVNTIANAGGIYRRDMLANAELIETNPPAIVYHVTGFLQEAGGAIMPAFDPCNGSEEVSIVRSGSQNFTVNIVAPTASIGNFQVNGNTTVITAANFSAFPSLPNWSFARVVVPANVVAAGAACRIVNTAGQKFQMGVIYGGNGVGAGGGASYGYFSDYSAISIQPEVAGVPTNSACSGGSVVLNADIGGAVIANATYVWSGPQTGTGPALSLNNVSEAEEGTYTVTVTDASGCTGSGSLFFQVNNCQEICCNGIDDDGNGLTDEADPLCYGSVDIDFEGNTGSSYCLGGFIDIAFVHPAGSVVTWTGPNAQSTPVLGDRLNILSLTAADEGTWTVVVNQFNGCVATATFDIDIVTLSAIATSLNDPCFDGMNFTIDVVDGVGDFTYNWTAPDGFVYGFEDPMRSVLLQNLAVGNYSITVFDALGCSATTSVDLICPCPQYVLNPEILGDLCVGSAITISADMGGMPVPGATYAWTSTANNNFTGTGFTVGLLLTADDWGRYEVTLTDANGCTGTGFVYVEESPNCVEICCNGIDDNGNGLIDGDDPQCFGNNSFVFQGGVAERCLGSSVNVFFNYPAGSTVTWTGPVGATNVPGDRLLINSLQAADEGAWTVVVQQPNGCTATATYFVNIVNVTVTAQSLNDPCDNGMDFQITTAGGSANFTYAWSGAATGSQVSGLSTILVQNQPLGTYQITVTEKAGCTATTTVTLTCGCPPLVVDICAPENICVGQPLTIRATLSPPYATATYLWSGPNNFTSTSSAPSIGTVTAANAGLYTLTVSYFGNCQVTASVNISVNPAPVIAAVALPNPTYLRGCNLSFQASGGVYYEWFSPVQVAPVATGANPTVAAPAPILLGFNNTYTYTVVGYSAFGCTSSRNVKVSVRGVEASANLATVDAYTNYNPGALNLSATSIPGAAYSWSNGQITGNTRLFSPSGLGTSISGTWTCTITLNGCSITRQVVVGLTGLRPLVREDEVLLDAPKGMAIEVSPNPAQDYAVVTLTKDNGMGKGTLLLTDINGAVVFWENLRFEDRYTKELPLGDLPAGTYLVLWKDKRNVLSQKLIKQ